MVTGSSDRGRIVLEFLALLCERQLCPDRAEGGEENERVEAKRFRKTKNPRKNVEDADTSPGVRGIAAAVKRAVWKRDGGKCTFVTGSGRRCPERHRLEYYHDDPYGLGGDRSANNIRLICRCHNLYMAELDYGKEKMDAYRRSTDRVGEPEVQLCPGTVEPLPRVAE